MTDEEAELSLLVETLAEANTGGFRECNFCGTLTAQRCVRCGVPACPYDSFLADPSEAPAREAPAREAPVCPFDSFLARHRDGKPYDDARCRYCKLCHEDQRNAQR